jgi:hypothetical protein
MPPSRLVVSLQLMPQARLALATMFSLWCISLYYLLVPFCKSLIESIFAGLRLYVAHANIVQQIAPPNSTLAQPRKLWLRSIALGIGFHTYRCQGTSDVPFQGSHGMSPQPHYESRLIITRNALRYRCKRWQRRFVRVAYRVYENLVRRRSSDAFQATVARHVSGTAWLRFGDGRILANTKRNFPVSHQKHFEPKISWAHIRYSPCTFQQFLRYKR